MSMSSLSAVMASPRLSATRLSRVSFGNGDPEKNLPTAELDTNYSPKIPLVPAAPQSQGWGKWGLAGLLTLALTAGGTAINKFRNVENTLTQQGKDLAECRQLPALQADKQQANLSVVAQMATACAQKSPECANLVALGKADPDLREIATRIEEKTK